MCMCVGLVFPAIQVSVRSRSYPKRNPPGLIIELVTVTSFELSIFILQMV